MDTLAALNGHHQTPGLLRFGSDGTGQGVRWLLGAAHCQARRSVV